MVTNKYTVKYDSSRGQWKMHNKSAAMNDYFSTKNEAVNYAKYRARDKHKGKGEVKVYKKNGGLQNTFKYGKGAKRKRKSTDEIFDGIL